MADYLKLLTPITIVATLAACSGDSGPTDSSSGGGMSNPPPSGTVGVNIQDFRFSPVSLTITVGQTVRWTNQGPSAHTTTSDNGTWASSVLNSPQNGDGYGGGSAGGSFAFTFTQAGTFSYHCSLHPPSGYPGFTGTITVNP